MQKWTERDTAILRLLIRKMRDEGKRTGEMLDEARKYFPERSAMAIKQKMYLMIKRRDV